MAKKISKDDISEKDIFENMRISAENALKQVKALDDELRQIANETAQKIKNVKFDSAKSINDFTKATKEANLVQKESIKIEQEEAKLKQQIVKIDQEIEKAKQQEQKTKQAELRTQQQINKEKERQEKAAQRAAKAAKDEGDAYKILVKETRDLKNESKRLGAEMLKLENSGKKNGAEYRKLAGEYNKVTAAAQKGDAQLKKLDKTVGDNFRNVGNYSGAINKLTGLLSGMGLAFGGAAIFRNVSETIIGFEQSIANLSSITGATGKDLQFLEEAAMRLGGATTLSASQVAEGFKLIGSAKPELLADSDALIQVTESAIQLAEAAGMELPDAAKALTNTLNQFGAGAEQAGKFVDILAAGSKYGAGDINFLNDAFEKAGTVANVAGLSFQETAAALEVIAKSGVPAEKAGTDFRNVLLKLQEEGYGFVDGQFDIKAALEQTRDMLAAIEDPAKRAATSAKLFGSQSVATGEFLMQNIDLYSQLNSQMGEVGIAAEQQAINTDTLGGALNRVKSAWEEYILRSNEAGGVSDTLKDLFDSLAENLELILDTVITLGKMWIWYKGVTLAQAAANKLLASSFVSGIQNMGVMKGAINGLKGAFGKLGQAIKANFIGILLSGVAEVIRTFTHLNSIYEHNAKSAEDAAAAQKELAVAAEQEEKEINRLFEALKKTNPASDERLNLINKINSTYGTTLQNLKDEKSFIDAVTDAQKKLIETVRKKTEFEAIRIRFEYAQKAKTEAELEYEKADRALQDFRSSGMGEQVFKNLFEWFGATGESELVDIVNAWSDQFYQAKLIFNDAEAEYEKALLDLESTATMPPPITPPTPGAGAAGSGSTSKVVSLLRDIEDEQIKQIADEEEREKKAAEVSAQRRIEDLKDVKAKATEKAELTKEINETLANDLLAIEKKYEEKRQELKDKSAKADKSAQIARKETELAGLEDTFENLERREELMKELDILKIEEIQQSRDLLLKNEELTEGERQKIMADSMKEIIEIIMAGEARQLEIRERYAAQIMKTYDEEFKAKKLELLNSQKTSAEVQEEMRQFEIEQLVKLIEDKKKLGLETIDDEIKLAELRRQVIEDSTKDISDAEQKAAERRILIAQTLTDIMIEQSDRRIAQMDKEIEAAEKMADYLRDAAAQGNIDAQQSLAEQQRIIDEANAKKEQEQRRQERIKMAFAAYEAYERNASDPNVKNPLAKTITDITLLKQFIATLPTFFEGTEDTGRHGEGVDGKGGFHAILHPNERVIPKAQNDIIGDLSNQELASLAQKYHAGKMIRSGEGGKVLGGPWESMEVIKKLDQLNHTIQNKAEHNINVEEIIGGAMTIVRQSKEKNSIIYNRYRVKN